MIGVEDECVLPEDLFPHATMEDFSKELIHELEEVSHAIFDHVSYRHHDHENDKTDDGDDDDDDDDWKRTSRTKKSNSTMTTTTTYR